MSRAFQLSAFFLLLLFAGCYPTKESLESEREELASEDFQWLTDLPPDLSHPLTLNEIIDLAICRNLELFVKESEISIQEDEALRVRWALLPQLNFNYEDSRRSQNAASQSKTLLPNGGSIVSPLYQVSSKNRTKSWDLGLVWNVLDFGITYFRARQEENKATIQEYEYERIRNLIILRATTAYWRAVSAKKALNRAEILLPEMYAQTERLKEELADRIYITKEQALSKVVYFYQREIQVKGFNDRNDSSDPAQGYGKEYESALLELATLMQLPPGVNYDIYIPSDYFPLELDLPSTNELFATALNYRPELYERDLDFKISTDNVNIAMISQFPSLQLFNIDNYNNNPFLLHNNWYQAGVRVAWNLLAYPQHQMEHVSATEQQERDMRNRLLLSEGVLSQVSLAYLLYEQNKEQFLIAKQVSDASSELSRLVQKEAEVGRKSKLEALQARIDAALALNNATKIYAELQSNIEQLNNAIGLPRYYSVFPSKEPDGDEDTTCCQ